MKADEYVWNKNSRRKTAREKVTLCEARETHVSYWLPELLNYDVIGEYSSEWKEYVLSRNLEEVNRNKLLTERFTFYSPNVVKSIFDICKMLEQPPEVRYLALDIFDRFLVHHFFSVSKNFKQSRHHGSTSWQIVIKRLLEQSLLRMLTCIQLAVKYCWSSNIISAVTIQEALEVLGHTVHYSKRSIIKSEARIYQNLNFNIPSKTPLTYLEMFFNEFQQNKYFFPTVPLNEWFIICIHVLDVVLINHQWIYSNFFELLKNAPEKDSDKHKCHLSFKADFVTLAGSVIVAASVLAESSKELPDVLVSALCSWARCTESDVRILAKEILTVIQSYKQ